MNTVNNFCVALDALITGIMWGPIGMALVVLAAVAIVENNRRHR